MEDIIVYLLVIIAIVVNVVRNYQKIQKKIKERDVATKPNLTDDDPIIRSILKPFSRQIVETIPSVDVLSDSDEVEAKTFIDVPTLENNYSNDELYEHLDNEIVSEERGLSEISEEAKAFEMPSASSSIELNLNTPDDLKKAFVYSLVFERKY